MRSGYSGASTASATRKHRSGAPVDYAPLEARPELAAADLPIMIPVHHVEQVVRHSAGPELGCRPGGKACTGTPSKDSCCACTADIGTGAEGTNACRTSNGATNSAGASKHAGTGRCAEDTTRCAEGTANDSSAPDDAAAPKHAGTTGFAEEATGSTEGASNNPSAPDDAGAPKHASTAVCTDGAGIKTAGHQERLEV